MEKNYVGGKQWMSGLVDWWINGLMGTNRNHVERRPMDHSINPSIHPSINPSQSARMR
jgi:hypothetical protein